jgi:hypothetical protein
MRFDYLDIVIIIEGFGGFSDQFEEYSDTYGVIRRDRGGDFVLYDRIGDVGFLFCRQSGGPYDEVDPCRGGDGCVRCGCRRNSKINENVGLRLFQNGRQFFGIRNGNVQLSDTDD